VDRVTVRQLIQSGVVRLTRLWWGNRYVYVNVVAGAIKRSTATLYDVSHPKYAGEIAQEYSLRGARVQLGDDSLGDDWIEYVGPLHADDAN
jgi:hypothetical protein